MPRNACVVSGNLFVAQIMTSDTCDISRNRVATLSSTLNIAHLAHPLIQYTCSSDRWQAPQSYSLASSLTAARTGNVISGDG